MITIRTITMDDLKEWLRMRMLLWNAHSPDEHLDEMKQILSDSTCTVLVVALEGNRLCGFLEAGQRKYADGCDTSPVGYIEGWYVDPEHRQQNIGAQLVRAAEQWARLAGLQEMASDCIISNEISLAAHQALGYEEVERLIHFRKHL